MDLLARREHSRSEIVEKLKRKYPESTQHFDEVLDQLEQDGLLSDERFAEAYTRYRRARGFGPLLVRQELRGKGIDATLLESVIDMRAVEWIDTLRELITKKRRLTSPCRSGLAREEPSAQSPCRSGLAREGLSAQSTCRSGLAREELSAQSIREQDSLLHEEEARARQKLYRFCLSRGFTADQIERAMR